MTGILHAALLGAVQGLTEFLPISSSGHLVIAQRIFDVKESGIHWAVCLHLATALAILLVFHRDVRQLARGFVRGLATWARTRSFRTALAQEQHFGQALLLVAATVPAGFVGLLFKEKIEALFESVTLVGWALLATGALLWSTQLRVNPEQGKSVGLREAFIMGAAQAIGLAPGISRSGITISCGILAGVAPARAGRFSFLMAVLATIGASLIELPSMANDPGLAGTSGRWELAVGFVVATLAGYWMLRLLLGIIQRGKFHYFAPYCWAVGLGVIAASRLVLY